MAKLTNVKNGNPSREGFNPLDRLTLRNPEHLPDNLAVGVEAILGKHGQHADKGTVVGLGRDPVGPYVDVELQTGTPNPPVIRFDPKSVTVAPGKSKQ